MICNKCNYQNEDTAKFCKNCGAEIVSKKTYTAKRFKWEFPILIVLLFNIFFIAGASVMVKFNYFSTLLIYAVVSTVFIIFCLIFSIRQIIKYKEEVKGIAITILIISSIEFLFLVGVSGYSYEEYNDKKKYERYQVEQEAKKAAEEEKMKCVNTCETVVINGVTWATCNLCGPGTFVTTPELCGQSYSYMDAKNVCPEGWRLPTKEEFEKLIESGTYWGKLDGVEGRFFAKGKLFFPKKNNAYWSSSLYDWSCHSYDPHYSHYLNSNDRDAHISYGSRSDLYFVRCVKK